MENDHIDRVGKEKLFQNITKDFEETLESSNFHGLQLKALQKNINSLKEDFKKLLKKHASYNSSSAFPEGNV